jgi:hypothetical protein
MGFRERSELRRRLLGRSAEDEAVDLALERGEVVEGVAGEDLVAVRGAPAPLGEGRREEPPLGVGRERHREGRRPLGELAGGRGERPGARLERARRLLGEARLGAVQLR